VILQKDIAKERSNSDIGVARCGCNCMTKARQDKIPLSQMRFDHFFKDLDKFS
jgi:hypothetical protein